MFSEKDKHRKFRAYLKKLMDKCQLTAYGLGQISKLDPTFIRRISSGQRNPSRRTVLKIAAALRDYSTVVTVLATSKSGTLLLRRDQGDMAVL
jgi:predicted transcriptional regulator